MIPENHNWVQPLIGKPWASGARGPDSFDCWGLIWHIYTNIFGWKTPDYPVLDSFDVGRVTQEMELAIKTPEWTRLDKPVHGCSVAMSGSALIHHVGMWLEIDGGLILHARDKAKVMAEPIQRIRDRGINNITFYQLNESSR